MFDHCHLSTARKLDQFYTPTETALLCIEAARAALRGYDIDRIIEPSAGAGAFSAQLPGCIAIDIDPKADGIVKADFLSWEPDNDQSTTLVIGNPPFGKNASTAIRFFNHAAGFADLVAFIVPPTFRKDSVKRRLDRNFHLFSSFQLEECVFLLEGEPQQMSCEFQIWERRDYPREIPPRVTTHADFIFCDRADADFAVQRVGANAGRIKDIEVTGSANSHFFIKANGNAAQLRARFETIDFDAVRHNTAGNPSVAKSELVTLYTQLQEHQHVIHDEDHGKGDIASLDVPVDLTSGVSVPTPPAPSTFGISQRAEAPSSFWQRALSRVAQLSILLSPMLGT